MQTDVPQQENNKKIILKIRGILVDTLVEMAPKACQEYVVHEKGNKVLCIPMLKVLCGMIKALLLCCEKFRKDVESTGNVVSPHNACVANKVINENQHALMWHVDDVKASYEDLKVNDKFFEWSETMCGSDENGYVTSVRGKKHDYLAMNLGYSENGKFKVDMTYFIKT